MDRSQHIRISVGKGRPYFPPLPIRTPRPSGKGCTIPGILRATTFWWSSPTLRPMRTVSQPRGRPRATPGRCPGLPKSTRDPPRQAGQHDHSHCHGDGWGSRRDWDRRELGAPRRQFHGAHQIYPRIKRETAGATSGGVPTISRAGVLLNADPADSGNVLKAYEAATRALKISLQAVEERSSNPDFERAFRAAAQERVSALVTVMTGLLITDR